MLEPTNPPLREPFKETFKETFKEPFEEPFKETFKEPFKETCLYGFRFQAQDRCLDALAVLPLASGLNAIGIHLAARRSSLNPTP